MKTIAKENQHYLPQMYLKGFLDPAEVAKGQHVLWVYEKRRRPWRTGVKQVGYGKFFYAVPPEHAPAWAQAPDYLESVFEKTETLTAPILHKLRDGVFPLTPDEKDAFASFIVLSQIRTPYFREGVAHRSTYRMLEEQRRLAEDDGALEAHVASMEEPHLTPDEFKEIVNDFATGKTPIRMKNKVAYSVTEMAKAYEPMLKRYSSLRWTFVGAPSDIRFIVGDNPVSAWFPEGEDMTVTDHLTMTFPISSTQLIFGEVAPGESEEKKIATAESVLHQNYKQILRAYQYVFASFLSQELRKLVDLVHEKRGPLFNRPDWLSPETFKS